jgi:hypothetical protein
MMLSKFDNHIGTVIVAQYPDLDFLFPKDKHT